jgi:alcohol dehydrogenase
MKAAIYDQFQGPVYISQVPDPKAGNNEVVIQVMAAGLCRSDWHGWMGNDPDITLPHVPGHELAGVVVEVGKDIKKWNKGDRVTLPFVCGCGTCPQCESGNHQVCDAQFQPGFTHWGAFAEYVSIKYADINLVSLPADISFSTAASLGCRFATSFRAVVDQGQVVEGQWVAVHGCGGVGLSAIMIARAFGAQVIAIDIADDKLEFAKTIGASIAINANHSTYLTTEIKDLTQGGVHLSIDALGSPETCYNSISSLRKRGKHIQVGIMEAEHDNTAVPIRRIIADELELIGSHGMQAYKYDILLKMIQEGKVHPEKLIGKTIQLEESVNELVNMNSFKSIGITVINKF